MSKLTNPLSSCLHIVEDESGARTALTEMLRTKAYRVKASRSGREFVSKVSSNKIAPDAVLIDIKMPGQIDGIEAAYHIQKRHPGIPIIFVTAFADNPDYKRRVGETKLKIAGWIDKPIAGENRKTLLGLIEKELSKKRIRIIIENKLKEKPSLNQIQTFLEQLAISYRFDFLVEVIKEIAFTNSSRHSDINDLVTALNFMAYENLKTELEAKYDKQFVAFIDGKLEESHSDPDVLISTIYQKHKRTDVFITKVSGDSSIIKLRRPRKIIR